MPKQKSVIGKSKSVAKRSKKNQVTTDSSDESFTESAESVPVEEDTADKVIKDSSGGLENMTEEEITQHLKLCMKLSAENKINMKNAFGLHLINIMERMVKNTERADIQQASLSLQASSKIYAGRVEALYQETCRFHGHLQSIVSGNKKEKKPTTNSDDLDGGMMDVDDYDDDRQQDSRKSRSHKKSKSFLKLEDTLRMETEVNALSTGEPHGNFVTINSAFCTSRLAPKLLSSLQIVNDSCKLICAVPEQCFKPIKPATNDPFLVAPKFESYVQKIKNLDVSNANFNALVASTECNTTPQMSTPKPAASSLFFNDEEPLDTGFPDMDVSEMPPPPPPPPAFDENDSVNASLTKPDVLNITVDAFVSDIASAITNEGVDPNLLPPNSALKKILDKSARKSVVKPTVPKSTRNKVKEPFFSGRSVDSIKQIFIKGRQTTVSAKLLSEWSIESISNIDSGYKLVDELYDDETDSENSFERTEQTQVLDVLKQDDYHYYFKYNFLKESQMWKVSRRKLCLDLSFNVPSFPNETVRRVASMAPNDPEDLAVSLQDLSLHDQSVHDASILDAPDMGGDPDSPLHVEDLEEQQYLVASEPFETDIEELMVKKPELVRPTMVKFSEKPVNLNTEKIKLLLWNIINKRLENSNTEENAQSYVLFSEVYEELKLQLKREISESISMQFAFVVLLILANQKTLLIENYEGDKDLSIKQDISEFDVSLNAL